MLTGQNDWRSLNLDPIDPSNPSFWAGDATSGKFYRFNIASGVIERERSIQSGQLSGLCVNGAFSAAQGSPLVLQPLRRYCRSPTATFALDGSKFRVTLNDLAGSVSLTARVSVIHKDAGFSDQGMPCTPTSRTETSASYGTLKLPPESGFSSADVQIFQPNTDMNTRVLKNEATEITTFVKNIDPGGRTRTFSVFSLNQASVTGNAVSCGYQSPVEGSVYNLGSTSRFEFKAADRPIAETAHSC